MPSRTGTASQVDASAGNGSTSVTVPSDCNCVVAFFEHWDGNSGSTLSSLTLNGVGFTIQEQLAEGAVTDENGIGVATLVNPSTGSQTLAWTWSGGGARSEGGAIALVYVADANTADPVRDTATEAVTASANCQVVLTTTSTDLVLGFAESFNANPAISGTVFINNTIVNTHRYDCSQVTAGASSTTITMTGEAYSCMAGIALKAAVAAKARPFRRGPLRFMTPRF